MTRYLIFLFLIWGCTQKKQMPKRGQPPTKPTAVKYVKVNGLQTIGEFAGKIDAVWKSHPFTHYPLMPLKMK